jgi:hypothetical protein
MELLTNRKRLVTFRLTEAEYESLRVTCTSGGSRSVSEFARSAVLSKMMAQRDSRISLGENLAMLGLQLEELDGALQALSKRIARVIGPKVNSESA